METEAQYVPICDSCNMKVQRVVLERSRCRRDMHLRRTTPSPGRHENSHGMLEKLDLMLRNASPSQGNNIQFEGMACNLPSQAAVLKLFLQGDEVGLRATRGP